MPNRHRACYSGRLSCPSDRMAELDGQSPREHATVAIVGGGPCGLTAALLLGQAGIDFILLERRDFTSRFPRAHLLNVRTMEIFHDVGVADDIYARSPPEDRWHRVCWYTSLAGPTALHGTKIGEVHAWGGGPDRRALRASESAAVREPTAASTRHAAVEAPRCSQPRLRPRSTRGCRPCARR